MIRSNPEKQIQEFFRKQLVPLSKNLHATGKTCLTTELDENADSYFIERTKLTMEPSDFDAASIRTHNDLVDNLSDIWADQDFAELSALRSSMAKLAKALKSSAASDNADEDVSEFIYVMY